MPFLSTQFAKLHPSRNNEKAHVISENILMTKFIVTEKAKCLFASRSSGSSSSNAILILRSIQLDTQSHFFCSFVTLMLLFIHVFLFVVSRIHFPFFTHLLLAIEGDNDKIEKSYPWRSRHTWSIFGKSDSSFLSEDIEHFLEKPTTLDFAR